MAKRLQGKSTPQHLARGASHSCQDEVSSRRCLSLLHRMSEKYHGLGLIPSILYSLNFLVVSRIKLFKVNCNSKNDNTVNILTEKGLHFA